MWDRKQIKEIFDKISNGRGYFELFYEILSLFRPDIRNLAEIAGQIMHVMNSNNPVLFYVKSNLVNTYSDTILKTMTTAIVKIIFIPTFNDKSLPRDST